LETCVILPTYNESENLELLVTEILALDTRPEYSGLEYELKDLCVLNVDDNSPDGTGELADSLAAQNSGRVWALHRPSKLGLGTAYLAGFERALELGAQRIITMDSDFSHNPRFIPIMIEKSTCADLVIGSRYAECGEVRGSPWHRRFLSYGANITARMVAGLAARDATAGFRLYHRHVLESIPFATIFSSGYSFLVEMLYLVQQQGWRVAEVPILFEDRRAGSSKISRIEIMRAAYTVARLGWRRMRR
jgi:glycosyltransferase involved in cell wall biosynthesis